MAVYMIVAIPAKQHDIFNLTLLSLALVGEVMHIERSNSVIAECRVSGRLVQAALFAAVPCPLLEKSFA